MPLYQIKQIKIKTKMKRKSRKFVLNKYKLCRWVNWKV